jgi:outer membrane protein assembly factor BamE (lipoprotein component of BamABCDE complex)
MKLTKHWSRMRFAAYAQCCAHQRSSGGTVVLNRRLWAVLAIALSSLGCVATLYGHRTTEGAPFRFAGLGELNDGMSFEQVRTTLGPPLEAHDAGDVSMWRYFERAKSPVVRWRLIEGSSARVFSPGDTSL